MTLDEEDTEKRLVNACTCFSLHGFLNTIIVAARAHV